MLVVRSDSHLSHHCLELDGGALIDSWERPERASFVDSAVDAWGRGAVVPPQPVPHDLLTDVHDPAYVEFLSQAWAAWVAEGHTASSAMAIGWPARRMRQIKPTHIEAQLGYYSFAADCSITAGTWEAALASASIADTAARHTASTGEPSFARCRPPGHHASRDQFGGYCYLNNAAVAAQRLRNEGNGRVAILDVDYHHGNGTQDIFYDRDDVLFCSIHADPREEFPYFLGLDDETGTAAGVGANRNIPLPRETNASTWFAALDHGIAWVGDHRPDALVVSLGVDTFHADPISHFHLGREDFGRLGSTLRGIDLPTVFVMEGGYATAELGDNIVEVLDGFTRPH